MTIESSINEALCVSDYKAYSKDEPYYATIVKENLDNKTDAEFELNGCNFTIWWCPCKGWSIKTELHKGYDEYDYDILMKGAEEAVRIGLVEIKDSPTDSIVEYRGFTISMLGDEVKCIEGKNTHVQGGDEVFFFHCKNLKGGKKYVDGIIRMHKLFNNNYKKFLKISGAVDNPNLKNEYAFLEFHIRNDK